MHQGVMKVGCAVQLRNAFEIQAAWLKWWHISLCFKHRLVYYTSRVLVYSYKYLFLDCCKILRFLKWKCNYISILVEWLVWSEIKKLWVNNFMLSEIKWTFGNRGSQVILLDVRFMSTQLKPINSFNMSLNKINTLTY